MQPNNDPRILELIDDLSQQLKDAIVRGDIAEQRRIQGLLDEAIRCKTGRE